MTQSLTDPVSPADGNRWSYDEIIEIMARGAWPAVFSERFMFPADRDKARAQSLDEMRAALRALCLNGLTVVPSTSGLEYPHVDRKSDNDMNHEKRLTELMVTDAMKIAYDKGRKSGLEEAAETIKSYEFNGEDAFDAITSKTRAANHAEVSAPSADISLHGGRG